MINNKNKKIVMQKSFFIFFLCIVTNLNGLAQSKQISYSNLFETTVTFSKSGEYTIYTPALIHIIGMPNFSPKNYGTYYIKDHYYWITTDPSLDSSNMIVNVYEDKIQQEEILIKIISPYENDIEQFEYEKLYKYYITMYCVDFQDQIDIFNFQIDSNNLLINKKTIKRIDSIYVSIKLIEDNEYAVYQNLTYKYFPKNVNINLFIFNFVNLNYYYFFYRRFKEFPIKMINNGEILYFNSKLYTDKAMKKFCKKNIKFQK